MSSLVRGTDVDISSQSRRWGAGCWSDCVVTRDESMCNSDRRLESGSPSKAGLRGKSTTWKSMSMKNWGFWWTRVTLPSGRIASPEYEIKLGRGGLQIWVLADFLELMIRQSVASSSWIHLKLNIHERITRYRQRKRCKQLGCRWWQRMNWFIQTKVFKVITAILLCWGSMVQCMGWLSRGTALEVILWTSAHRGKVIPSSTVAAHHTRLVRRAVPSTVSLIRTAKSTRSRATLLERRVLTLIVAMTPGSISMVTRTPSRETAAAAAWARAEMHLLLRLLGFDDFCVGHHRCLPSLGLVDNFC